MTEVIAAKQTRLKALLKQRHLQGHVAFKREYNRVAKKVDPELVDSAPCKAQFYRWLSGELTSLPYADHCRVLEEMFKGWTAAQLFELHDGTLEAFPESPGQPKMKVASNPARLAATPPITTRVADIVAAFTSRSDFMHEMPPHRLFSGVKRIRIVGLSLNLLCQSYPDKSLQDLLEAGTRVECLFLDPEGQNICIREQEEGHQVGHLANLTSLNIQALRRIEIRLSDEAKGRLEIRCYDETARFNITILDNAICIVQPYLPDSRGVESPTLVLKRQDDMAGLYDTFTRVFESMWDRAKEVGA